MGKSSTSMDAIPLLGAGATAIGASGTGTTITTCSSTDQTTYCKFIRAFNIFKMLLFVIGLIVIVYFLIKMYKK